jgi:hypothetical protein
MIIEKTNEQLTLDTSTLLGGTADIFGSYVKVANFYSVNALANGMEASLYWISDGSTTIYSITGYIDQT